MLCCATERRRSTPAPKEEEKVNEEQWPLREVVFVEDVKNVPVGKVGGASGPDSLFTCVPWGQHLTGYFVMFMFHLEMMMLCLDFFFFIYYTLCTIVNLVCPFT